MAEPNPVAERDPNAYRDPTPLLHPRSIAIVGASTPPPSYPATIYYPATVYSLLQAGGFPGPVYLVHPRHTELYGTRCYPSLAALPEVPEQVIVIVRATR